MNNATDYKMWREQLNDIQIKIDQFDQEFWTFAIVNMIEGEAFEALEAKWKLDREELVKELETHLKAVTQFIPSN